MWAGDGHVLFFFSSRRRHTRCLSDWSSDVCSSDLVRRRGRGIAGRESARADRLCYAGQVNVGITCYPTYGGSGIVATELGMELAARGHEVHFITYANPIRLDPDTPRIH